jgi:hypothetical protein
LALDQICAASEEVLGHCIAANKCGHHLFYQFLLCDKMLSLYDNCLLSPTMVPVASAILFHVIYTRDKDLNHFMIFEVKLI